MALSIKPKVLNVMLGYLLNDYYPARILVDFEYPEGSGWCLNHEPILEKVPACHPFFTRIEHKPQVR